LIHLPEENKVEECYHDHCIWRLRHGGESKDSISDLLGKVKKADAVIIITNHRVYDHAAMPWTRQLRAIP